MQKKHIEATSGAPVVEKKRRGRPVGTAKGGAKSSTERVRVMRASRLQSGGVELSTVLRPEPSMALAIIAAVSGIEQKSAVVESVLIQEALRLASSKKTVDGLIRDKKITPELGRSWLEFSAKKQGE